MSILVTDFISLDIRIFSQQRIKNLIYDIFIYLILMVGNMASTCQLEIMKLGPGFYNLKESMVIVI